jgi:hypothetical protein
MNINDFIKNLTSYKEKYGGNQKVLINILGSLFNFEISNSNSKEYIINVLFNNSAIKFTKCPKCLKGKAIWISKYQKYLCLQCQELSKLEKNTKNLYGRKEKKIIKQIKNVSKIQKQITYGRKFRIDNINYEEY